jgi:hypothetical protein
MEENNLHIESDGLENNMDIVADGWETIYRHILRPMDRKTIYILWLMGRKKR